MSEASNPLDCAEARRFLASRQDGELGPVETRRLETHLTACAACRSEADAIAALSAALRDPSLVFLPPPDFRVRMPGSPSGRAGRALPLAAAFVVGALLALAAVRILAPGAGEPVAREVVAAQIRASLTGHVEDVESTDRHTVKPWFSGKIPYAPPVVDLAAEGYPLVGGRIDYVAGRTVAVLVYGRRQHRIGVYVWPSGSPPDWPSASPAEWPSGSPPGLSGSGGSRDGAAPDENGFHVLRRSSAGMDWWIVADVDRADLERFADLLARRAAA